jgi:hypothetical protein
MRQKLDLLKEVLETPDNPINTLNRMRELFGLQPQYYNMMQSEHQGSQSQKSGNKMDVEHAINRMMPGDRNRDLEDDDLMMDDDTSPANR